MFNFVTIYVLGNEANLSVGAPFCRNTPNKTLKKELKDNKFEPLITLSIEDIKTLNNIEKINNYEEFKNKYNKIFNAVQAKCIGTSDGELKKKLEEMFENIINNSGKNEDLELKKKALIGMTEGSIKDKFTLESIKAATTYINK